LGEWGGGEDKDELLIVNCELLIINGDGTLRVEFKRLRRPHGMGNLYAAQFVYVGYHSFP
jgi:hypothetical protein